MALPSSSKPGTVRTVIHQPMKNRDITDPQDASITAIGSQHPGKPRLEGPPLVPPTAATRKHTAVCPVYDDFATAHSSITSRSTNGRSRDVSHKRPKRQSGLLDRGRPLPRRTLKSLRRQKKQPMDDALTAPMPAKTSDHRPISEFDFDISDAHFTSSQQHESKSSFDHLPSAASQKRASASPFLGSLKRVMGGKSSPVTTPLKNGPSFFKWPRDSMEMSGLVRNLDLPIPKMSEDGRGEMKSLRQFGDIRLPELPFYLDDPLVYKSNQDSVSAERVGIGYSEAYDACQHDRERPSPHDNHNADVGQGVTQEKAMAQTQKTLDYFHGGIALAVSSQATLSTREGSTVDNIVKQYARNNGLWDISLDSNDEDSEEDSGYFQQLKSQKRLKDGVSSCSASGLEGCIEDEEPIQTFKLMGSSGRVPNSLLPQIPLLPNQQTLKSASERLGNSSSYENTHDLLNISPRSQWDTGTGLQNFHSSFAPHSGKTAPSCNNPFRRGPNQKFALPSNAVTDSSPIIRLSQAMDNNTSDGMENPSSIPSIAFERDISRALRRMSAISNSSQELTAHYQGDGGFQSSTDSSGLLSFIGKPNSHAPEPLKLVTRGFYHESAIRQTWLDSRRIERVRIPISRNLSTSSSLPVFHLASPATDEFNREELNGLEPNGTEWETVFDGVMSRVRTAGSSLANNSSVGNISPILYERNDFSSTDRIIQHPAQIDCSHDYRYRAVNEGNFPVLLPSYKPHAVNGFPANSLRSINPFQRPSADLYLPPLPLSKTHTNPFRSPPPEVIGKNSASSEIVDQDSFLLDKVPLLKLGTFQATNNDQSIHWMDEFGDPGPAIRATVPTRNLGLSNHSMHSLSESHSGSQIIGSSIADASSLALSTTYKSEDLRGVRGQRVIKSNCVAGCVDGVLPLVRERVPFIKGPPGAFYQGVRSRPDPRCKGQPLDRRAVTRIPQRKVGQNYQSNQMRPLSLLQVQHAELTAGVNRSRPERRLDGNFLYRSPLAPIKSKSWCDLYTREQLGLMHKDAKKDEIDEFKHMPRRYSRPEFGKNLKLDGSWKRTWSPHLHPWPRENSSIKTDLSSRKVQLSSLIFGLCCLFPPMLVLYGVGYLDNIMLWATKGEISSFSKAHKKVALKVACFFIIAILIAVPIIVTLKVIRSK